MNQRPVIARAKPEEIKVKETYTLYTSYGPELPVEENTGQGKIEIKVPYDGKTSVTKTTLNDLKKQMRFSNNLRDIKARIGYIGFHDHENTDLDEQYALNLRHNLLAFELQLNSVELSKPEDLTKDMLEQVTTLTYTPAEIKPSPIFFNTIKATDEYDLIKASSGEDSIPDFFRENWKDFDNKLVSFYPTMIFTFLLSFNAPLRIQPLLAESLPFIADMSIEWPVATSINHINVFVESAKLPSKSLGEKRIVKYDPRKQWIRWGNISFQPEEQKDGSYKFSTPEIRMSVREPGELFKHDYLNGELLIKFSSLYSGLKLAYFDAMGQQTDEVPLNYATEIKLHFKFNLRDLLQGKIYTPYQIIQFPKVVLNQMRVNDIMTLLRDERYKILFTNPENFPEELVGEKNIKYSIFAIRDEGFADLILILDLEGKSSLTEREKEIPEGEKFISLFGTGETICSIRGWFPNDPKLVVQEINRIHAILKHRFHHVSVLD